jgi:hypothetical protein
MKLNPQDLEKIADLTLEHYNQHAEDFWEGTRDHDVSQNIEALLQTIEGDSPFAILDFGCGPRRDLKVFPELVTQRTLPAAFAQPLPRARRPRLAWLAQHRDA